MTTTFYANSDVLPGRNGYQVLTYKLDNESTDVLSLEIPSVLLPIKKDNELYKVTIEKLVTDKDIETAKVFDALRGVSYDNMVDDSEDELSDAIFQGYLKEIMACEDDNDETNYNNSKHRY